MLSPQMRSLSKTPPPPSSTIKSQTLSKSQSASTCGWVCCVCVACALTVAFLFSAGSLTSNGMAYGSSKTMSSLKSTARSTTRSTTASATAMKKRHFAFSTCSSGPRESAKNREVSHADKEAAWNDRFQVCVSHLGNQVLHDTQREYFDTAKTVDGWTPARTVPRDIRTNARFSTSAKKGKGKGKKGNNFHFYPTIGQKTSQDEQAAVDQYQAVVAQSSKQALWNGDQSTPVSSLAVVTGEPITNGSGLYQNGGLNTYTNFRVPHSAWTGAKGHHSSDSTRLPGQQLSTSLWNYEKPLHIYSAGFATCAPLTGDSNQGICK